MVEAVKNKFKLNFGDKIFYRIESNFNAFDMNNLVAQHKLKIDTLYAGVFRFSDIPYDNKKDISLWNRYGIYRVFILVPMNNKRVALFTCDPSFSGLTCKINVHIYKYKDEDECLESSFKIFTFFNPIYRKFEEAVNLIGKDLLSKLNCTENKIRKYLNE